MKKSLKILLASLLSVAPSSFASTWDVDNWGIVETIMPCSNTRFEVQLKDVKYTGSWGGNSNPKPIRFVVDVDTVGAERFKQYFAMSVASHTTGGWMWLGSNRFGSLPGFYNVGNCGTGNVPARYTRGMTLQYDHP